MTQKKKIVFTDSKYYNTIRDSVLLPKNLDEWPQNRWDVFLSIASEADKKKVEGFIPATWGTYMRHELFTDDTGNTLVIFAKDSHVDIREALMMEPPGSHTSQQFLKEYMTKNNIKLTE
jgi:hypothetical protein